jgi:hypothetical protein
MKFTELYRQEIAENRYIVCSKTADDKFCLTQQIKVNSEKGSNFYFLKNSLIFEDIQAFGEFIDGMKEALGKAKESLSEAPE